MLKIFKFKIVHAPNEWLMDFDFSKMQDYLSKVNGDVFTWWQRYPDVIPRYRFPMVWDNMAVCEFESYEDWWRNVGKKTRNMVRKAIKSGVKVEVVKPNIDFFEGVTRIYNETPIRQGKYFKHYGSSLEDVLRKFRDWLDEKNVYIGAYWQGELVGFVHLILTDKYCLLSQILSYLKHRDKAVNYALISEAVRYCSNTPTKRIVYYKMERGSLGIFKKNVGFKKRFVPRYFIPLSRKGQIFIKLNLYKLPYTYSENIPNMLKQVFRPLWKAIFGDSSL